MVEEARRDFFDDQEILIMKTTAAFSIASKIVFLVGLHDESNSFATDEIYMSKQEVHHFQYLE